MTNNIAQLPANVKHSYDLNQSKQNDAQSSPDVFEQLLNSLREGIQQSKKGGEKSESSPLQEHDLPNDESILPSDLKRSSEHADQFKEIGVLGHKLSLLDPARSSEISKQEASIVVNAKRSLPIELPTRSKTNAENFAKNNSQSLSLGSDKITSSLDGKNIRTQTNIHLKTGAHSTKGVTEKITPVSTHTLNDKNFKAEEIDVEKYVAEAETREAERRSRATTVYRAIAQLPTSQVHIALYALERGMRLLARVSDLSDEENMELRDKINNVLAQYGISGAEVIIENISDQNSNKREK